MNSKLGAELMKVGCPKKYCAKPNLLSDILPILISSIIVAYFSGNLLNAGGFTFVTTLIIEGVFVAFCLSFFYFSFKGVRQRLSETYMSVRENGIYGIRAVNGYKNATFELEYSSITSCTSKTDRIFIKTKDEKIVMTLEKAAEVTALINEKL
ncbi:MAG: hypothetical protein E7473_03360 [Ruminococcaceae bacterium]|nr:hypothetical protein [Oscillospiraceae bacterium]